MKTRSASLACAVSIALSAGCASTPSTAVIQGQRVPRPDLRFTGKPYSIEHSRAHPAPGRPSEGLSDLGGNVRGQVCGSRIGYFVEHLGDRVRLTGSVDMAQAGTEIRDVAGERVLRGWLGALAFDVRIAPAGIYGQLGAQRFAWQARRDVYADEQGGARVRGRAALLAMPPADQGALLPMVVLCALAVDDPDENIGFGGAAAERPSGTLSFADHQRQDEIVRTHHPLNTPNYLK